MLSNPTWRFTEQDAAAAWNLVGPQFLPEPQLPAQLFKEEGELQELRRCLLQSQAATPKWIASVAEEQEPSFLVRVPQASGRNPQEAGQRVVPVAMTFTTCGTLGAVDFSCADSIDALAVGIDGSDQAERRRRQRRRKVGATRVRSGDLVGCVDPIEHTRLEASACQSSSPAEDDDSDSLAGPDNKSGVGLPFADSKWHSSASSAGNLSEDSHIFAKPSACPRKSRSNGMTLSSLCMIFERTLRVGGFHQYRYSILEGSVGAADGVGFVFDSRIRRTNIQRMRSVFLNKHGQVCLRNLDSITKLPGSLPRLTEGISVFLTVDLDHAAACFKMFDTCGKCCGVADLSFASLLAAPPPRLQADRSYVQPVRSGFFCAIVTGNITVSLH